MTAGSTNIVSTMFQSLSKVYAQGMPVGMLTSRISSWSEVLKPHNKSAKAAVCSNNDAYPPQAVAWSPAFKVRPCACNGVLQGHVRKTSLLEHREHFPNVRIALVAWPCGWTSKNDAKSLPAPRRSRSCISLVEAPEVHHSDARSDARSYEQEASYGQLIKNMIQSVNSRLSREV